MAALNRFEDRYMREEALKAFVRALHTDRMVAITGVMSTQALGYPSWNDFVLAYAAIAKQLANEIIEARTEFSGAKDRVPTWKLLNDICAGADRLIEDVGAREPAKIADRRVSMWTLHELFRTIDREMRHVRAGLVIKTRYQASALEEFERRVAAMFLSRLRKEKQSAPAAIRPLIRSLGIKRVATLNYDLELERAFMLREDERLLVKDAEQKLSQKLVARLKKKGAPTLSEYFAAKHTILSKPVTWPLGEKAGGAIPSVEAFIGSADSGKPITRRERGRLSRTMGDGVHVESDVVNRERSDRLFEFAIGSAEISRHILHLHGRADAPETMVANIRQYDRLYRLDDLYRDPFDHGLRMLIGGNPILFVGIGMTEQEINDQLQYFVSNTPIRRPAPIFVLWNRDRAKERDEASKKINRDTRHGDPEIPVDEATLDKEWCRYKEARRLDFRIRLGVYLIFDDDFEWQENVADSEERPEESPAVRLPKMMEALPVLVKRVDRRVERHPDRWRSIEERLKQARDKPCRMWGSHGLEELFDAHADATPRFDIPLGRKRDKAPNLIFAYSENGYGRGELSEYLARLDQGSFRIGALKLNATLPGDRLLVNAGFSYDSDALLSGVARFLAMRTKGMSGKVGPCREKHFAQGALLKPNLPTMIIINGADRFFGSDGAPLSSEFDHWLRCVKQHGERLQVLLLGTSRMRRYCQVVGGELQPLPSTMRTGPREPQGAPDGVRLGSSYLDWVAGCFARRKAERDKKDPDPRNVAEREISAAAKAMILRAGTVDRDAQKRTFFEAYLAPPVLRALDINCPATFEALRTLSFVGTPVEGVVLLYAPKVRAMLAERNELTEAHGAEALGTDSRDESEIRAQLAKVLDDLCKLGLLIALDPHDPEIAGAAADGQELSDAQTQSNTIWRRYGMHRSLATFLRDRHGAPINDAKLATTFNMSMFMSEPSDATTPEATFHDELGDLVDSLSGAWHDTPRVEGSKTLIDHHAKNFTIPKTGEDWVAKFQELSPSARGDEQRISIADLYVGRDDKTRAIRNLPFHAHRDVAASLRAALSVVRGYYSTGALLKFDRDDRIANTDRDGALTEHAQRLERLISVFGDIAIARSIVRRTVEHIVSAPGTEQGKEQRDKEIAEIRKALDAAMGPEPLYGDDLVWLFNERATVALAQGHLFEAREALSAADRVNNEHVEKEHHGHNWRRIAIGRVAMRIERGSLKPAERLLDDIDVAVNSAPWCKAASPDCPMRVDAIRKLFKEDSPVAPIHGTKEFTREEIFIVAMGTGYRGLIAHLRGRYHEAKGFYEIAVRMLRELGEQRAYAHFQRHWATLEGFFGKKEDALREIEHAIAAAQAARQMDILHRSRVVRADLIREISQDETKRRTALQDIKEALRYAALADCYRVRIEASASLARHMRIGGDYDTALRYGVDAMTIAARYGHSLQKTSLRIELGRILEARGDPISGRALLDQAVAIGTAKGYNHALERVRRALNPTAQSTNWTYVKIAG